MRRFLFLALVLVPLLLLGGMTEFPFGGGHIIEDEGTARPDRPTLNFTGAGVTCTDDAGGNETDCVITAGGGAGTMTTVQEGDVSVGGADIVTLDFLAADFDISEAPDTEINIVIAAAIARDTETCTGGACTVSTDDTITIEGGTTITAIADDELMMGSGAAAAAFIPVPNCTDVGGNHLNYTQATNTLSCGTTGAVGGDAIEIEDGDNLGSFTAIDTTARFDDQGQINFQFTDGVVGGPDTVDGIVRPDVLDFTEFEDTLDLDAAAVTTINIIDNQTLTFDGTDGGTTGPAGQAIIMNFTLDEQFDGGDTWIGLDIVGTNNRQEADSDSNTLVRIRSVATANDGDYLHLLDINHPEGAGDPNGDGHTLEAGLRISGSVAGSMLYGIDLSAVTGDAINLGLNALYSTGDLTIGDATDTDSIVFQSDAPGFVRIDGNVITGNLVGNPTGFFTSSTAGPAGAGALRLANIDEIHWEAAPVGTDVQIGVDANEQFQITSSIGGIGLVTTTATVCKTLEAADINCDTTAGCATVDTPGTVFDYIVATFATGADDFGAWTFPTPENISGSTFTAEILWTSDNAACNNVDTSDDVCWTVAASGISNSDPWNAATLGAAQAIVDRCILNGDLMHSAPTVVNVTHGWIADEMAVVEISRDVDAGHANCAADAYPFNALLLSLKICYEVDNVFSGE